MIGEKQSIIDELWVVYGYTSYKIYFQPIYNLYHGYDYSYLMLTNSIGRCYLYRAL